MPAKVNDGERWIINSGSGVTWLEIKALTDKERHLLERFERPHLLETTGGMTTT